MTNRLFTKLTFALAVLTSSIIGGVQAQTYEGVHFTREEVAVWRQRVNKATSVNYASNGDVVDYSPGDWDRIKAYADEFLANPAQETWIGSAIVGGNAPYWQGVRLENAAFAYLVMRDSDPTKAMQYANAVRNILVGQVVISLANISLWTGSLVQEQGFNEARWIQRMLFAYDYIKNSGALSATDKTLLNNWFLAQGNWFANNIQTGAIGECFPQRLSDNYTVVGRDAKPNGENYGKYPAGQYSDGYDYTHVDASGVKKNKIAYLAKHWNNRRADKASAAGMIGVFLNNSNLINHAKQYAKEWLKYSVYPDGTMGEYERNGDWDVPQQGMSYGAINMQQYILLADALARKGDLSLYQYSTTAGLHGTEVPTGGTAKSLKLVIDKYCANMQATPAIYHLSVTSTNRIDSYSEGKDIEYTWDVLLTIANKYYRSEYYKSIYTRTAPQVDNFPAPENGISSASAVWFPWGGTGAELPGLSLMYGQMEDKVSPYTSSSFCNTPDGLTVPYVGARHTRMVWNHTLGAVSYNIQYRIGSGSWTTVNNHPYTYLDLNTLTPGSQYEWQVQAVSNSCTGPWATSIFVTTPEGCTGTGYLTRTYWKGLLGKGLNDLPFTSRTPTSVTNVTIFEAPSNVADDYGQVLEGFVCAPKTGNYTFWVAGDDEVDVWVSSDDTPSKISRAAFTSGYTASRQWTKASSQKSGSYYMVAGYRYYIRMRHKEAVGNDYAAVGWTHPDGVSEQPIPSSRLSPYAPNAAPTVSLTAPANGSSFATNSNINLTANANDADGTILRVEFYQGSVKIGESTKAPYFYSYQNVIDGTYTFKAVAIDNKGVAATSSTSTVTVTAGAIQQPGGSTCSATGFIHREIWENVTGSKVANIPVTTTPTSEDDLSIFETETNRGSNYGQRLRGYVCPPATGSYTFWIAGDDDAELYLSTDANPSNKRLICRTGWWTGSRDWTKYANQQSVAITLTAGTKYYIEALHKEASSNDNFAVGWKLPSGTLERPIPGSRLSPWTNAPASPCANTGSVTHEFWSNKAGTKIADIPTATAPATSTNITSGINFAANRGDNYGERFRGYICAPTTGTYTFYVAGDDQVDFYISTDNDPAKKSRKAYVNWSTNPNTYTKEATQASAAITLTAGTPYYFEVLHKEGTYGDHVALAWKTPGSSSIVIVPASNMAPYVTGGARIETEESGPAIEAPGFTLFPNPATNQVTIRASRPVGVTWRLELISQVGQKVLAVEDIDASASAEASLDLTQYHLIPGLYLVRLRDGEGRITTHKFIKSE